jgi:hypothetical protein
VRSRGRNNKDLAMVSRTTQQLTRPDESKASIAITIPVASPENNRSKRSFRSSKRAAAINSLNERLDAIEGTLILKMNEKASSEGSHVAKLTK